MTVNRTLPTDSNARKDVALFSGCYKYFAAALAGVARWSKIGNDKHNSGQPMHHARGKSADHADCIARHMIDIADLEASAVRAGLTHDDCYPPDIERAIMDEADALAWRALAWSQELHERYAGAPLAPAAVLPEPEVIASQETGQFTKPAYHQTTAHGICECGDPNCDWSRGENI